MGAARPVESYSQHHGRITHNVPLVKVASETVSRPGSAALQRSSREVSLSSTRGGQSRASTEKHGRAEKKVVAEAAGASLLREGKEQPGWGGS